MTNKLVSIIVPAYNHELYVRDCLESIHAQTHPRMELVVVDDCSPDRTFEIVQSLLGSPFADRFERVVLRRKSETRGAYDSLNVGLELAEGDYIAIINSDDLFTPRRLERLLQAMGRVQSEFAFSLVDVLDDRTATERKLPIPEQLLLLQLRQRLAIASEACVSLALLRWNVAVSSGNFIFSSHLAKKLGGFAPLAYCHDWDFILQAAVHTEPIALAEPLYRYRLHGENSFRRYEQIARKETEVVYRRFFRSILRSRPPNAVCPGPQGWPGYFETLIQRLGLWPLWAKEAGERLPAWRIYESPYWGAVRPPGEAGSIEQAIRLLAARLEPEGPSV